MRSTETQRWGCPGKAVHRWQLVASGLAVLISGGCSNECGGRAHGEPGASTPIRSPVTASSRPTTVTGRRLKQKTNRRSGTHQWGHSNARTWLSAQALPTKAPRIRWRFATGRPIAGSAVVDDYGNSYFGSLDGFVYALDPRGSLRWKAKIGRPIYGTPTISRQCVVVGADDESVRCYHPTTGALRWRMATGPCARAGGYGMDRVRCHVDGSALWSRHGPIVAADALYAISPQGKLRWRLHLPGHARSSAAMRGNFIVVGTQGHAIVAADRLGKQVWRKRTHYHCDGTPAISGDRVYLGCDDGLLRALALRDGKEIWSYQTRGALRGGVAVTSSGQVVFGSTDGRLRALAPDGSMVWILRLGGAIVGTPAVDTNQTVVVGSRDDHLYGIDGKTGTRLWRVRLGGDIDASVAVGPDGTMLVGCDDGRLYALGR